MEPFVSIEILLEEDDIKSSVSSTVSLLLWDLFSSFRGVLSIQAVDAINGISGHGTASLFIIWG